MLRALIKLVFACAVVFAGAYLVFHARQDSYRDRSAQTMDAETRHANTIVLTGGPGRIKAGLALLRDGRTDHVFVSGVARTYRKRLLPAMDGVTPDMLECCVTLGFQALDTAGNGKESAAWLEERTETTVFLVTSRYHMPRALVELRRWAPAVSVTPITIDEERRIGQQVKEFLKYGAALTRLRLQPGQAAP